MQHLRERLRPSLIPSFRLSVLPLFRVIPPFIGDPAEPIFPAARSTASLVRRIRVPEVPYRVDKPWGYELIWARTDRYVGKILHVKAGHVLSLQYHNLKDETMHVLRGELILRPRRAWHRTTCVSGSPRRGGE